MRAASEYGIVRACKAALSFIDRADRAMIHNSRLTNADGTGAMLLYSRCWRLLWAVKKRGGAFTPAEALEAAAFCAHSPVLMSFTPGQPVDVHRLIASQHARALL